MSYNEVEQPDDNIHCHKEATSMNTPLQKDNKQKRKIGSLQSNDTSSEKSKRKLSDVTKLETVLQNHVDRFYILRF